MFDYLSFYVSSHYWSVLSSVINLSLQNSYILILSFLLEFLLEYVYVKMFPILVSWPLLYRKSSFQNGLFPDVLNRWPVRFLWCRGGTRGDQFLWTHGFKYLFDLLNSSAVIILMSSQIARSLASRNLKLGPWVLLTQSRVFNNSLLPSEVTTYWGFILYFSS